MPFQCSSASRKFLNCCSRRVLIVFDKVSVLFSEPKIPQSGGHIGRSVFRPTFQCSSASRKFLNYKAYFAYLKRNRCFSALQRAENSSIWLNHAQPVKTESVSVLFSEPKIPQYVESSALVGGVRRFSALQRAENSSIVVQEAGLGDPSRFQCSSASRKFLNFPSRRTPARRRDVSVLFSEPKIPQ